MTEALLTRWGKALDIAQPLGEYPRPQLVRDSYINLNGLWEYAFSPADNAPAEYEGQILVPFSPESALSGVGRHLGQSEALHYRRYFTLPEGFHRGRVLLHFGAVDQTAAVTLNGTALGRHEGGYLPFSFDITAALRPGENELCVSVRDSGAESGWGVGKQSETPGGIWYSAQSGIWQTVWLESVPESYLRALKITPLYDEGRVRLEADCAGELTHLTADVYAEGRFVAGSYFKGGVCVIPLPDFRSWTPETPFLYELRISSETDRVQSYFAMRKFSYVQHEGHKVFALNNQPYFHKGLLDQGYWPDGLLTPPADAAMVCDIQTAKDMGFNTLRKHIKVEPLRWYYHCDRLGMLVWQDMVSGGGPYNAWSTSIAPTLGFVRRPDSGGRDGNVLSRQRFLSELRDTVSCLYNCPCIALWTPFNEGWGQFNALDAAVELHQLDPGRYIDHASGWQEQDWQELKSRHIYFRPIRLKNDGRALALTEFGGYTLPVEGHCWSERRYGYRSFHTPEALWKALKRLWLSQLLPHLRQQGLTAIIYTQLCDVEEECNGLVSYDREVLKLPAEQLRKLNEELHF